MKALMQAIQSRLKASMPRASVWLMQDADVLPSGVKFPFIGLKDGTIIRDTFSGASSATLDVEVYVWAQVSSPEGPLVGHGVSEGVFDLAASVISLLDRFEPDGYQWMGLLSDEPSQEMSSETGNLLAQRKKLVFRWDKN